MAAFLPTGILGFTTFPAFSLDVALLYERSAPGMASFYVLASIGFSVAALFLGLFVIRQFV
jgi:CrcB protein